MDTKKDVLTGSMIESVPRGFPLLAGAPEHGKWYSVTANGCVSANGKPYHAVFRCGTVNKLIVYFFGGGCVLDASTASHPIRPQENPQEQGFYFDEVDPYADALSPVGLGSSDERNPFRNWHALFLTYGSGDFHVGTTDYTFVDENGDERTIYLHGYRHYQMAMEQIAPWVPEPEQLLVAGSSAGGFATSLLTDDVMRYFPKTRNVTCCIDGALLLFDGWHEVAQNIWKAPKELCERIHGRNLILDGLRALYQKHGTGIRYLLIHSVRDGMLGMFQASLDGRPMVASRANADVFHRNLMETWEQLQRDIPTAKLFVYDLPFHTPVAAEGVTLHTILQTPMSYEYRFDGVTTLEWIERAINPMHKL